MRKLVVLSFAFTIAAIGRPQTIADAGTSPIARWFDSGRCAAFDAPHVPDGAPLVRRDSGGILIDAAIENGRGYSYDPRIGAALFYPSTDSAGTFTLRTSAPPPPGVPRHDLRNLHTTSGIWLGSRAESVTRLLGTPKIVRGCGLRRFVYERSETGEPTTIQFTIASGRVVEIFEDFGG